MRGSRRRLLGATARLYLLLSLVQQTDYVTDYDSEYDSCSSRPFVCPSVSLAGCLSVRLSGSLLTPQHVACPSVIQITLISFLEVELSITCKTEHDINTLNCTAAKNINTFFKYVVDLYCFRTASLASELFL